MMKRFLGILVLGLLWCNVGFADEKLEKLIKEIKAEKLENIDFNFSCLNESGRKNSFGISEHISPYDSNRKIFLVFPKRSNNPKYSFPIAILDQMVEGQEAEAINKDLEKAYSWYFFADLDNEKKELAASQNLLYKFKNNPELRYIIHLAKIPPSKFKEIKKLDDIRFDEILNGVEGSRMIIGLGLVSNTIKAAYTKNSENRLAKFKYYCNQN